MPPTLSANLSKIDVQKVVLFEFEVFRPIDANENRKFKGALNILGDRY